MNKANWFSHPLFYIAIIFYFLLGYMTLTLGNDWAARLYPEDHYFENMGAISLFVASAISLYLFFQALKARKVANTHWIKLGVYLGFALLYFFGAGEEISWGQRIFNFQEPPQMAEENVQGEFNIHNLAIFENSELLKADTIFTVFWMAVGVLIPAASLVWKPFRQFAEKFIPIPYWGIGILFILNYIGAKAAKILFPSSYHFETIKFAQAVQEIKESNYELLFVFLSLMLLWDLNSRNKIKAEP